MILTAKKLNKKLFWFLNFFASKKIMIIRNGYACVSVYMYVCVVLCGDFNKGNQK
jgi:hypothetical protein